MRTWRRPIGPLLARPGRRRAHGCAPRDSGEVQARLKPEQTAKINMPVVLLTGQESTDPSKAQVGPVAAALPMHTGWHWPDSSTSPTSWTGDLHEASAGGSCTPRPCTANWMPSSKLSRSSPGPHPRRSAEALAQAHSRSMRTRGVGSPPALTPPLCHALSVRTKAAP